MSVNNTRQHIHGSSTVLERLQSVVGYTSWPSTELTGVVFKNIKVLSIILVNVFLSKLFRLYFGYRVCTYIYSLISENLK